VVLPSSHSKVNIQRTTTIEPSTSTGRMQLEWTERARCSTCRSCATSRVRPVRGGPWFSRIEPDSM
jgi:hypothetical protein